MKKCMLFAALAAALAAAPARGDDYVWNGGASTRWDDADNWTGGASWPGETGGDTAYFAADATISEDFAIAAGKLTISNAVNTTLNLNCSISGEGAIFKCGAGTLELRKDSTFSGGFSCAGTKTANQGHVHLYAAQGLGGGTAIIDTISQSGTRLDIHGGTAGAPLVVPTDIRFGADLSNTGTLKLYGFVTFTGKVYPTSRWQFYSAGDGGTHTFNAVNNGAGNFFPRVGANDTIIFNEAIKFSDGCDIYTTISSGSSNGGRVLLNASGNAWKYFHINSDSFKCGAGDALPKVYYLFDFVNADARIDLNGHNQTITQLSTAKSANPWRESSASSVKHGFTNSSETAASIAFVGLSSGLQDIGFRGRLTGRTGLIWAPTSQDATFTFSNTVQTTSGSLVVSNGIVCVTNGAGFSSLSLVELSSGAKLSIAPGLTVVASAARIGGVDLPDGNYDATGEYGASLPGGGTLSVLGYSEDDSNIWRGGSGDWNVPANWSRGATPVAGEKVVIDGGSAEVTLSAATAVLGSLWVRNATVVFSGTNALVSAGSVRLFSGAKFTTPGPFAAEEDASRVWIACGDIEIARGATIDLDGKGFASGDYAVGAACNGYGPGRGLSRTGASHGGLGGHQTDQDTAHAKDVYDDPEHPSIAGSGGYKRYANTGCHGGGVLRLEATGDVTVNGVIRADGGSSSSAGTASRNNDTAASGGAIWITCRTIGGAGAITARGGNGDHAVFPAWRYGTEGLCPPGGGGMIAIHYDAAAQAAAAAPVGLTVSAACGYYTGTLAPVTLATQDYYFTQAELGSVWFTDATLVSATLGRGLSGRIVHPVGYSSASGIDFADGYVRFEGEGVSVSFGGDVSISGAGARLEVGGVGYTNRSAVSEIYCGRTPVSFSVDGNFTVSGGGRFDIRSAATNGVAKFGATVSVSGSMSVDSGSRVVPWSDVCNSGSASFSVGGDFTVAAGGAVVATGRGCRGGCSGGLHTGTPYATTVGAGLGAGNRQSAASYGGVGGRGIRIGEGTGTTPPEACGSWCYPNDCGSGGGSGGWGSAGVGGGLVRVFAGGAIVVDGEIAADGTFAPYYYLWRLNNYNAGSGGAVYLSGATFSGSGSIHANGGESHHGWLTENGVENEQASGSGGGGRIAIWTGAAPDESRVNAAGSRISKSQSPIETDGRLFAGTVTASAGVEVFDYNVAEGEKRHTIEGTLGSDGTVWFFHRVSPLGNIIMFR